MDTEGCAHMDEEQKPHDDNEINPSEKKPVKESFYDRIPLTKKQLDIIIIILIAAVILFFVLGALKGNHII